MKIHSDAALRWTKQVSVVMFALTLGCPKPPKPAATEGHPEGAGNCAHDLETASADLPRCASKITNGCEDLKNELQQIANVNPANKQVVSDAQGHLGACEGQGVTGADCKAVGAAIEKLKCE
jgi:hypothetical protein